jgi:hypothetical protein
VAQLPLTSVSAAVLSTKSESLTAMMLDLWQTAVAGQEALLQYGIPALVV